MRIGRYSEHRFVFVFQLIEVIREAAAHETSGELGLALPGNLVGEFQLDPDTMLSNMVPLESVELEYHDEWRALNSPSMGVSVVFIRCSRDKLYSPDQQLAGGM